VATVAGLSTPGRDDRGHGIRRWRKDHQDSRLDTASPRFDNSSNDERYDQFIQYAEAIVQVRNEYQGEGWWETIDARGRLATLRKLRNSTARQREEIFLTYILISESKRLSHDGKYEKALSLAHNAVDILEKNFGRVHHQTDNKSVSF